MLFALLMMFLLALATQRVMAVVSQQAQREREAELLRVGSAIAAAIGRYHEGTPGTVKRWPSSLEDLLDDRRMIGLRRHLREVYADPITRQPRWGLVAAPDGGIAGVYSLGGGVPITSGSLEAVRWGFAGATSYQQWRFVYVPTLPQAARP
ncbi:MAG: type II secretion system protein [Hydrogenophaga sp.]|uniref:type II secretion system protein n=1 Tax=Hydrogenophaga sp. TaxID=1904254 RepID=UPI0016950936|nr:type II secretion system protein [Hydrogenophaga sp.]NIM43000.1 type II secretion system protein [Hydrogenophaga sp.]NIN28068.1 type II secretion system protein [Hydrogenophaga sp.]NIN30506.1 type II secretion system protein [Hydrogenophaga sp.]NIN57203.1 type II secretion system protein [Hydrogenophaga sp.]NIO51422.1 type II secretion system protein [Hydrogenophaga sp.]